MEIKVVFDESFKSYGKILEGYDYSELFLALSRCPVPEKGISYIPSVSILEECSILAEFQSRGFGGMPVQAGYCNGFNQKMNCLEYHKSSEFNITRHDIILMLGHQEDINDGKYDSSKVKAFYVPAGTGIELYASTLHYAPCSVKEGVPFQVVCVLPKRTNAVVSGVNKKETAEDKMHRAVNKWLLAHPDSEEAKEGAYIGITGDTFIYTNAK